MIYHPNIIKKTPYSISIWNCSDFEAHWHSNTEIYFCLEGSLNIRIEQKDHFMGKDDVLLVAANEAHEIFCNNNHTRVILLEFGYPLLGSKYDLLLNCCFPRPLFKLDDEAIPTALRLSLCQIRDILTQDPPTKDWQLRSQLYTIAASLAQIAQPREDSEELQTRARQLRRINSVLDYICDHFREPITVDDAAAITGYDKSHFSKQFRTAVGMPFHRYLNYYRICIACHHLSNSSSGMAEIAERSGFSSQKMMSRLFQSFLGITPTQYRNLPEEKQKDLLPF